MKSRATWVASFLLIACGQTQGGPDAASDAGEDESVPLDATTITDATVETSSDTGSKLDAQADADASVEASIDAGLCGQYESNGPYGCNKLLPPTTSVPATCVSESPASGGTITDDYYELTAYELDTNTFDAACPTGITHSGIVMFCSGTMLWLDIDQNSSSFDSTGTYSTNGNTMTISPLSSCSGNKDTYEYSATSTTFEVRGGSPTTFVFRYTLK